MSMRLRFWGVRGSLPVPGTGTAGIGGNTSCVEIALPAGDVMLIDCGTGARAAGISLQRRSLRKSNPIRIFFSHFHWDHINGLPFFSPLYAPEAAVAFYSHVPVRRLMKILAIQWASPYFPAKFAELPAQISFHQISDRKFALGGSQISSFRLNHPQGAWGYRVEDQDHSVVYASDHEHGNADCDRNLRKAAQNADVLIYDAQLTPSEYRSHRGWGHSTWQEGARLANEAGVKKLILFHHGPGKKDHDVRRAADQACKIFPATIPAVEGLTLNL